MKFLRTCREVAALVSEREDRELALRERLSLRAHVFICKRCTAWEKHIAFMRQGVDAWKNYKSDGR
jgi:hypothetical protein